MSTHVSEVVNKRGRWRGGAFLRHFSGSPQRHALSTCV